MWPNLQETVIKSLMENIIFCAVFIFFITNICTTGESLFYINSIINAFKYRLVFNLLYELILG